MENKAQPSPVGCISLPPHMLRECCEAAGMQLHCGNKIKRAVLDRGRHGKFFQRNHTKHSKEEAAPPLASSAWLQEASDYADTHQVGLLCKHPGNCQPFELWIIICTAAEAKGGDSPLAMHSCCALLREVLLNLFSCSFSCCSFLFCAVSVDVYSCLKLSIKSPSNEYVQ